MGQALYRKYRSRSLDELVGQEHITHTLARALKAGRISHAYLFTGPRGVGKTSVARILAYEMNHLPYSTEQNLDIIEIDAASNRRIDDIRDLREKVSITPISAQYKVYIIDEVHMLTGESFNALLKTLEEPPEHVKFILATTEAHKLPATIRSRTQHYTFRPVAQQKVVEHLRLISEKENIKIDDEALKVIAEQGEGSLRDSLSILDQVSNISTGVVTSQAVSSILGLAPAQQIAQITKALSEANVEMMSKVLTQTTQSGIAVTALVEQINKELLANIDMTEAMRKFEADIYDLIGKLTEIPRSYNPSLKLTTTLLEFTYRHNNAKGSSDQTNHTSKNAPAIAATPAPVTIAKALPKKTAPVEIVQEASKPAPAKPVTREPQPAAPRDDAPLKSFTDADWHTVLAEIKKQSPPLFSVAKQAQPVFNLAEQELTLKFKFQLHRKKLDDPKQKVALADIMVATLGGAPTIKTDVDSEAVPPPPPPADPTVASVAAIMGGGEVIDAATT